MGQQTSWEGAPGLVATVLSMSGFFWQLFVGFLNSFDFPPVSLDTHLYLALTSALGARVTRGLLAVTSDAMQGHGRAGLSQMPCLAPIT